MSVGARRWLTRLATLGFLLGLTAITALKLRFGGGAAFPVVQTPAAPDPPALEALALLPLPPVAIAASPEGRLFVALRPAAAPGYRLAEVVDGAMRPFPSAAFQNPWREPRALRRVQALRLDRQDRLWVLDDGHHGRHPARLLAFSLANGAVVHEFVFPRALAGWGSHLADLQLSSDGRHAFIADASFLARRPGLIVYDTQRRSARRVLDGHPFLEGERYTPRAQGRRMELFGLISVRAGVSSLALSPDDYWLYLASLTGRRLYRVQVTDLLDATLGPLTLAQRLQPYLDKPMTASLAALPDGRLVLADPEYARLLRTTEGGGLETLLQNERLRWPTGLATTPTGELLVVAADLQKVLGRLPWQVRRAGPYGLYRLTLRATLPD